MTFFCTRVGYYQWEDVSLNDGPNFFWADFFIYYISQECN